MLGPGELVPAVEIWTGPGDEPILLRDALGAGLSLLCFYVFDWSPT